MSLSLKPCPFCGPKSDLVFSQPCSDGGFGVTCRNCHTTMDVRSLDQDSVATAWNTRAEATEAQARRIAELEAERDEAWKIAGVFSAHWPYGQHAGRDEALRIALCAVPPPRARARALLPTDTKEPSDER